MLKYMKNIVQTVTKLNKLIMYKNTVIFTTYLNC